MRSALAACCRWVIEWSAGVGRLQGSSLSLSHLPKGVACLHHRPAILGRGSAGGCMRRGTLATYLQLILWEAWPRSGVDSFLRMLCVLQGLGMSPPSSVDRRSLATASSGQSFAPASLATAQPASSLLSSAAQPYGAAPPARPYTPTSLPQPAIVAAPAQSLGPLSTVGFGGGFPPAAAGSALGAAGFGGLLAAAAGPGLLQGAGSALSGGLLSLEAMHLNAFLLAVAQCLWHCREFRAQVRRGRWSVLAICACCGQNVLPGMFAWRWQPFKSRGGAGERVCACWACCNNLH